MKISRAAQTSAQVFALGLAILFSSIWPGPLAAQLPSVALEPVTTGLASPLALTHAGDGRGRLFVTLQGGRIAIFDGNGILPQPFLDISNLVSGGSERGLLSVAFHPSYPANGQLFVFYTDLAGDLTIARYRVSSDPDRADPASGEVLLTIPHRSFSNHNGGQLGFGPDGFLYASTGDGGGGGDPGNNAQDLGSLLGKLLRLDVDSTSGGLPYAIPPNNPFLGTAGARGEIWAYGLRNPWRFSFDRETGDLWIADVGQNLFEEVNLETAPASGGQNYGWRLMEANACFNPSTGCDDGSLTRPIFEYDHSEGCSITGGYVYRGQAIPNLAGAYVFGDFCSGTIWMATPRANGGWRRQALLEGTGLAIAAFGEDEAGELYVVSRGGGSANIQRLVASAGAGDLVAKPKSVNFGNVKLGRRSKLKRVTITNEGELPVTLGAVFFTGTAAAEFDAPAGRDGCSGETLAPGARCRLRLRFEPTDLGSRRATLVAPAGSGELRVAVRGRGKP